MKLDLKQRPVIIAIAGPNGAGKSTFYHAHLSTAGLLFINADRLGRELDIDPYAAARIAAEVRHGLVDRRESFIFETVFSDPVGDKLAFLTEAAATGYQIILCFIGLSHAGLCEARVAMRVAQGGHDVPTEKLMTRYPRSLVNLQKAIQRLQDVRVFDNSDLETPFRQLAVFEKGKMVCGAKRFPKWFASVLRGVTGQMQE